LCVYVLVCASACMYVCVCKVRAQTLIRGIGHRLLNWRLMESGVFTIQQKNHFLRGDRKRREECDEVISRFV